MLLSALSRIGTNGNAESAIRLPIENLPPALERCTLFVHNEFAPGMTQGPMIAFDHT